MKIPTISLRKLERILYREDGIVNYNDVPLLMEVLYKAVDAPLPRRLEKEVKEAKEYAFDGF